MGAVVAAGRDAVNVDRVEPGYRSGTDGGVGDPVNMAVSPAVSKD